jgi:hypothetical protein
MGIDGIGKGAGVGAVAPEVAPTAGDAAKIGTAAEPFRVDKGSPLQAASPTSLDRVRSGDISVYEYLDAKVSEVTSHIAGRVTPDQLAFVQNNLREQLSTDPVLLDLVKAATGSVPTRRE